MECNAMKLLTVSGRLGGKSSTFIIDIRANPKYLQHVSFFVVLV